MASIKNNFWFWPGFLVGLFYFGWIFRWVWGTFPLNQFGIENKIAAAIIVFVVFIISSAVMALWWGMSTHFGFKFIKRTNFLTPLVLASVFTITEYARSVFFSIFWYGSGGTIGPYWPLGNLAYLFVDFKPLALSASWWGIYGISFWIIFVFSSLIIALLSRNYKICLIQLICAFGALMLINLFPAKLGIDSSPIQVALVQTNMPPLTENSDGKEMFNDFKNKIELVKRGAETVKNGVIILPEGANFTKQLSQFLNPIDVQKYFNSLSEEELLILDNIKTEEDGRFRSKALLISSLDGLVESYDKKILSPGGEFLPYLLKWPFQLFKPSLVKKFESFHELKPGNDANLVNHKDKSFGVLICSEFKSPQEARKNNGDFLVITGNFSSFNGTSSLINQDRTSARFRAIENAKYALVTSNYGQSYIIGPKGNIEKVTTPNTYELLTGTIVPNKNRTWYNYVGDWPILLISLAFLGLGITQLQITYFTNIRIYKLFIRRFVN